MKALVYLGPKEKAVQERPMPVISAPTDAIVKMVLTTICGTDLHILKGDVPTCQPGRILGHGGVGVVQAVGTAGLWDRNISITTRLVDTASTPMLLKTLCAHRIDPKQLITHRFKFDQILKAYETFASAAETHALKVIIAA